MKVTPEEMLDGLKAGKRYLTDDGAEFTLANVSPWCILFEDWYYHVEDVSIASLLKRIEVTVIEKEPDVIVDTYAQFRPIVGYPFVAVVYAKPGTVADVEKALKELAEGNL